MTLKRLILLGFPAFYKLKLLQTLISCENMVLDTFFEFWADIGQTFNVARQVLADARANI
jgi:hypothetical protein